MQVVGVSLVKFLQPCLQAWHLQNVLFFVYLIVFTANPINKNVSLSEELEHLIGPELGG